MLMFIVGVMVGVVMSMFALGLVAAADADDEKRPDMCRGCPYEDYSGGKKDCAFCHGVEDL